MKREISIIVLMALITSTTLTTEQRFDEITRESSKDIHVEAFVRGRRIMQLNITLLKPINSSYDVVITSVISESNKAAEHCLKLSHCVIHGIPENKLSVTFPENPSYLTEHEPCIFQNECTYNISVKPLTGKSTWSSLYYIKECVDGFCSCLHADKLPKPLIVPHHENNRQLKFKWKIETSTNDTETNDRSLQYMTVDIDELRDCNVSWSNTKSIASFHENLDNFGTHARENDYTKDLNGSDVQCVQIRMRVYDIHNCQGPMVNKTVQIFSYKEQGENISWQLIIICIAVTITVLVTIVLITNGLLWKTRKKNIINYWRGVYQNGQHGGGVQMVPMRDNILYFEKESDEDWFEISRTYIKEIGREIGKGAFGRVYIARLADVPGKISSQIVAIKKLKKCPTTDQLEEFIGEIHTMKKAGNHPNVVRLLGFCTLEQPFMMIMEYIPCGDLLKYLRIVRAKHESILGKTSKLNNNNVCNNNVIKHSTSNHSQILGPLGKYLDILHSHSTSSASETSSYITQPDSLPSTQQNVVTGPCTSRPSFTETMYTNLTVIPSNSELSSMISTNLEYVVDHKELHNFAIQIARGMKHLEDLQITHRDLAARNILIDENKTLKISDFGLSRTGIYVNTKNKKVPLRWLSVEAMKDNLYSSKSDVWAFAIVLWEIGTLGGFPYPTVSNHELLNFLKAGKRLERPENCSDTLYELMLHCWATDPDERPDFDDICQTLDPSVNRIYIDFNELSPNYVFPPTSENFIDKNPVEKFSKV